MTKHVRTAVPVVRGEAGFTRSLFRLFQVLIDITLEIKSQIIETHRQREFQVMDKLNTDTRLIGNTFKEMTAMTPVRGEEMQVQPRNVQ